MSDLHIIVSILARLRVRKALNYCIMRLFCELWHIVLLPAFDALSVDTIFCAEN